MTHKKYRRRNTGVWIRRLFAWLFLIGVLSGIIFYTIFISPVFQIKEMRVAGAEKLKEDEIIQLSALSYGDQFFGARLSDARNNIETHPYIREASVKRKGVSTINIVVSERQEYAIIPYMGSYIYLDQEQYVLDVTEGILSSNICLITGIDFIGFNIGQKVQPSHANHLEDAYQILAAAIEADILDILSEINVDESGQIRIMTFNGIEALMGHVDRPAYSVLALKEALITLHTRNLSDVIIDMRYEGHITVQDRARQEVEDDKP